MIERLYACSIRRNGAVHVGFRSHADLRRSLGDANPYVSNLNDEEGFASTEREFIERDEAMLVALECGQISSAMSRRMLSSDLTWDGTMADRRKDVPISVRRKFGL